MVPRGKRELPRNAIVSRDTIRCGFPEENASRSATLGQQSMKLEQPDRLGRRYALSRKSMTS